MEGIGSLTRMQILDANDILDALEEAEHNARVKAQEKPAE